MPQSLNNLKGSIRLTNVFLELLFELRELNQFPINTPQEDEIKEPPKIIKLSEEKFSENRIFNSQISKVIINAGTMNELLLNTVPVKLEISSINGPAIT